MERKYIDKLFKVCRTVGVVPWGYFRENVLIYPLLGKVLHSVLFVLITNDIVATTLYQIQQLSKNIMYNSIHIMDALQMESSAVFPWSNILNALIFKKKKWNKFFTLYLYLDAVLKVKMKYFRQYSYIKIIFILSLTHLLFLAMAIESYYMIFAKNMPLHELYFTTMDLLQSYNSLSFCHIVMVLALCLKRQYEEIGSYLAAEVNKIWHSEDAKCKSYQLTEHLYRNMAELVDIFNDIFGFQILFFFAYVVASALSMLDHLILVQVIDLDEKSLVYIYRGYIFMVNRK